MDIWREVEQNQACELVHKQSDRHRSARAGKRQGTYLFIFHCRIAPTRL